MVGQREPTLLHKYALLLKEQFYKNASLKFGGTLRMN